MRRMGFTVVAMSLALAAASAAPAVERSVRSTADSVPATAVIDWSNEARRAIVPSSAGAENYGNKFPGEAPVYLGIVHVGRSGS